MSACPRARPSLRAKAWSDAGSGISPKPPAAVRLSKKSRPRHRGRLAVPEDGLGVRQGDPALGGHTEAAQGGVVGVDECAHGLVQAPNGADACEAVRVLVRVSHARREHRHEAAQDRVPGWAVGRGPVRDDLEGFEGLVALEEPSLELGVGYITSRNA